MLILTETVRSFFGIISWTLSLITYIMDELLTLLTEVEEDGPISYDSIEARSISLIQYVHQQADHHQSRLATPLRWHCSLSLSHVFSLNTASSASETSTAKQCKADLQTQRGANLEPSLPGLLSQPNYLKRS